MKLHRIDYEEGFTSDRTIIVLHGLFGSGRNWTQVAKQMSQKYRVLTVDLRNHGLSPWDDVMTYEAMAVDIVELIREESLIKPILLGHSMGGKVAMTAGLLKPDLLAGLIAVDIAPVTYNHSHLCLVDLLRGLDIGNYSRRSEADAVLAKLINDPILRGFLLHNLVYEDGGMRWQINLDVIASNIHNLMQFPFESGFIQFSGPSFFIGGANSDFILSKHYGLLRNFFPISKIKMIEGAGHWVHAEKPEEFCSHIIDFIGSLPN